MSEGMTGQVEVRKGPRAQALTPLYEKAMEAAGAPLPALSSDRLLECSTKIDKERSDPKFVLDGDDLRDILEIHGINGFLRDQVVDQVSGLRSDVETLTNAHPDRQTNISLILSTLREQSRVQQAWEAVPNEIQKLVADYNERWTPGRRQWTVRKNMGGGKFVEEEGKETQEEADARLQKNKDKLGIWKSVAVTDEQRYLLPAVKFLNKEFSVDKLTELGYTNEVRERLIQMMKLLDDPEAYPELQKTYPTTVWKHRDEFYYSRLAQIAMPLVEAQIKEEKRNRNTVLVETAAQTMRSMRERGGGNPQAQDTGLADLYADLQLLARSDNENRIRRQGGKLVGTQREDQIQARKQLVQKIRSRLGNHLPGVMIVGNQGYEGVSLDGQMYDGSNPAMTFWLARKLETRLSDKSHLRQIPLARLQEWQQGKAELKEE